MSSTTPRRRPPARRLLLAGLVLAGACHRAPPADTPEAALAGLRDAAATSRERDGRRYVTARTLELMRAIEHAAREIQATNVPADVLGSFLDNLARQTPELTGSERRGDEATLLVRYRSGHAGRLTFRREDASWKLDLSKDLEPSLALLEGAKGRLDALARGEIVKGDDDD